MNELFYDTRYEENGLLLHHRQYVPSTHARAYTHARTYTKQTTDQIGICSRSVLFRLTMALFVSRRVQAGQIWQPSAEQNGCKTVSFSFCRVLQSTYLYLNPRLRPYLDRRGSFGARHCVRTGQEGKSTRQKNVSDASRPTLILFSLVSS